MTFTVKLSHLASQNIEEAYQWVQETNPSVLDERIVIVISQEYVYTPEEEAVKIEEMINLYPIYYM